MIARQLMTTNELRLVFHFDISSIIGVSGKDGGVGYHNVLPHTLWVVGSIDQSRERGTDAWGCLLFCHFFCLLYGGLMSGVVWPRRSAAAAAALPLSPSLHFLDLYPGPDAITSCFVPASAAFFLERASHPHNHNYTLTHSQIPLGTRGPVSRGLWMESSFLSLEFGDAFLMRRWCFPRVEEKKRAVFGAGRFMFLFIFTEGCWFCLLQGSERLLGWAWNSSLSWIWPLLFYFWETFEGFGDIGGLFRAFPAHVHCNRFFLPTLCSPHRLGLLFGHWLPVRCGCPRWCDDH